MKASASQSKRIYLARVRGFCAGVRRAIDTVNQCLEQFGPPVYVFHAIVHNRYIVEDFEQRGVVFVEDLAAVPTGCPLVFSAHGVARRVEREARQRGIFPVIDATCPLVKRVHRQVRDSCRAGETVILVGHREHPEIVGSLGQTSSDDIYVVSAPAGVGDLPQDLNNKHLMCIAQTTLTQKTVDAVTQALNGRFPEACVIQGPTVCYASANRQDAVRQLAGKADPVLIVGSPNSSNANRLREVAEDTGARGYLIDSAEDFQEAWIADSTSIGISAGASTPEYLVTELLQRLTALGWDEIICVGEEAEKLEFRSASLPLQTHKASND